MAVLPASPSATASEDATRREKPRYEIPYGRSLRDDSLGSGGVVQRLSLATAPMLAAGILFAGGTLLGRLLWITPGILLTTIILVAGITLLAARLALRCAWPATALAWLLLGMFLAEAHPGPSYQRQLTIIADNGGTHTVLGYVTRTTPVERIDSRWSTSRKKQEHKESIDLQIRAVDGRPIDGGLRASIYAPADVPFPRIHCGDQLAIAVSMRLPERYRDPDVWNSVDWLRRQGIGVIGSAKASAISAMAPGGSGTLSCQLHSIQQDGTARLLAFAKSESTSRLPRFLRLNHEDAGMLSAMILGDRTYLNRQARVGFERTGSFHLLVVSGMHIAIFAGFIFAIAALLRLSNVWATLITIFCSFGYALLTGYGAPVQRSFWMVALFLVGRLFYRQRNSLNAIGLAALSVMAWNPHALTGASLQMTLLSVIAVAGFAMPIASHTFAPYLHGARRLDSVFLDTHFPPRVAQFRVTLRILSAHLEPLIGRRAAKRWFPKAVEALLRVLELLLVSTTIELVMVLPMAVYFHRITLLALPVNILVVPLMAFALPAALIAFAAIVLAPGIAVVPAAAAAALLHTITGIVRLFGSLPAGNIRIPGPGAGAILGSILLLGFAAWAARNSRLPVLLATLGLAAAAACALIPRPLAYRQGVLEVTGIDVGQGDSILVVTPQGKTLLVDAGGPTGEPSSSDTSNFDVGEDVVSPVLWGRNIRRLDAVELTHAHSDHMGGMPAVLRNFRPRQLWVGKNPHFPAYDALLQEAHSLGIEVRSFTAGDSLNFGGVHINVLSPQPDYRPGRRPSNDDSLVIHVQYGHTSALLEGDAQKKSEEAMLPEHLEANLLKVGHHGSSTSTTPAFLAEVDPQYALISVGHRNPYHHPRPIVLERLQDDHVRTYRTDDLGATSFFLNGTSVVADPLMEH